MVGGVRGNAEIAAEDVEDGSGGAANFPFPHLSLPLSSLSK